MIKEVFKQLDAQQRETIMLAFNECRALFITLEGDTVLGCNISNKDDFEAIEETDNGWFYGRLKERNGPK